MNETEDLAVLLIAFAFLAMGMVAILHFESVFFSVLFFTIGGVITWGRIIYHIRSKP